HAPTSTGSCCRDKKIAELGDRLAVFKPVCKRAQSQSFDLASRLLTVGAVGHDSRQCRDLRKPATVFLLLELHLQHGSFLSTTNLRSAGEYSRAPCWAPERRSTRPA